jgi:chorismate dehydratase
MPIGVNTEPGRPEAPATMTRSPTPSTTRSATRLGAVNYLNTEPLLPGLREAGYQITPAVPSRCWEMLVAGEIDVGIVPVIGLSERPDLVVVPEVAIASEGPVRSVLLVTRREPTALRSVALDRSSRTSAALLRILCAECYGVEPEFVSAAPDWRAMLADHDGALLIGDAALELTAEQAAAAAGTLRAAGEDTPHLIDLGAEWTAMTGLPFVFAVWAGVDGRVDEEVVAALIAARDRGIGQLADIARTSAGTDERRALNLDYLRHAIRYQLGEREMLGLERFLELAARHGLAPPHQSLRFAPRASERMAADGA